jgi:uncharacterized protein (TIGR00251 family)
LAAVNGSPIRRVEDGVTVAIRLTPKAKANRIVGLVAGPDGAQALKTGVTAAPERGKANAALLALLAKAWRLPKSTLSLSAGARDRRKVVHIAGDPALLKRSLDDWMDEHHG